MKEERIMKKVRIDAALIEQIQWYDLFPKGMWTIQARTNYLVQIGLAVLMLRFKRECKENQSEDQQIDALEQLDRNNAISLLLKQAEETKIPYSELARLVSRSLYE